MATVGLPLTKPSRLMLLSVLRPRAATDQAFALQYTSLILIILTFLVGAFIRPHLPHVAASADPVISEVKQLGSVSFRDLFIEENLNEDIIAALVLFASNHDVQLQIEVFGGLEGAGDSQLRIAQAVSRSVTLQRHFIDRGVPPQALDIRASGGHASLQARVNISPYTVGEG